MRILLIEDDKEAASYLVKGLTESGHVVDHAADGEDGLYMALTGNYDIVVVDRMLPKRDGLSIIRMLRADGKSTPVLVLSALGEVDDRIEGLRAGGDDYLVKPFEVEELLARLRALVRRAAGWTRASLQCGPLVLDTTAQTLQRDGASVELTGYEYRVLEYLMLHSGEVVSKTELTEHLYEEDHDRDSNVIEVFIRRLRAKLDPDGTLNPIETLRGRGYRFTLARGEN